MVGVSPDKSAYANASHSTRLLDAMRGLDDAAVDDAGPFKAVVIVLGVDALHQTRIHG